MHYAVLVTIINDFQKLSEPLTATYFIDVSIASYNVKQTAIQRIFHNNVHSEKKVSCLKEIDIYIINFIQRLIWTVSQPMCSFNCLQKANKIRVF